MILVNVNKAVGLLRRLQNSLPRTSLSTICSLLIRTNLEYGDLLNNEAFNNSFKEKLESIHYNTCLALTGEARGTSKKIYFTRSWKMIILNISSA